MYPQLTDEKLKEVAEELNMEFAEVKLMYERASTMGLFGQTKGKELLTKLKALGAGVTTGDSDEEPDQREGGEKYEPKTVKPSFTKIAKVLRAAKKKRHQKTQAQLKEAIQAQNAVLSGLVDQMIAAKESRIQKPQQSSEMTELVSTLKDITNVLTGRSLYDSFTSKMLSQEADQRVALKEGSTPPKSNGSLYDAATSQALNQNNPAVLTTTKETDELAQAYKAMYNAFTSQGPQADNRPKSGNEMYDHFTSQNLNQ